MKKRSWLVALPAAAALLITACSSPKPATPAPSATPAPAGTAPAQVMKIRASNLYAKDTSFGHAMDLFAKEVQEKSNGKIQVQVFHNNELGDERTVAEQLKNGGVEVEITGLGGVGAFVKAYQALELPYLYNSIDQLASATQQLKDDLIKDGVEQGFRPIGFMFDGPRNTLSKKPINSLADYKGLKFRVPGVPAYSEMAKALGASPMTVALPEVYSALQTGTVDAMEGTADTVYQGKYFEQAKYYVQNKHVFQILYLVASNKWYSSLSPDLQKAVDAAAQDAAALQVKEVQAANQAAIDKMKAAGVTVIDITDLSPFKAATKEMNAKLAAATGDEGKALLDKVLQITSK